MDTEYINNNNNENTDGYKIVFYKFLIIIFFFCISFFFGYLPAKVSYFTTNYKLIGIANSFSGGIFLCVALLHLLPESAEIFDEYFEAQATNDQEGTSSHKHKNFPFSFLLAFVGYTIILIIEKVIFDSHTHLDADDDEEVDNNDDNMTIFENKLDEEKEIHQVNVNNNFNITIPIKDLNKHSTKKLVKDPSPQISVKFGDILKNPSNLNLNENNLKKYLESNNFNLNNQSEINKTRSISMISKGKRDRIKNYLETFKLDTLEKNEEHFKNLFSTSGKISNMIMDKDNKSKNKISNVSEIMKPSKDNPNDALSNYKIERNEVSLIPEATKESITPYLLLLALSIHASFEGLALGLQANLSEIFYMFLAISFHKWVEALSIGINLNKSKIEKSSIKKFIILFSSMTPLGIILGMIFSGFSKIIEACFLSISAGSFIYISASEVVIEEFSVSNYKYEKFLGFLAGACIILLLTIFEHHH